jgi:rfaE bifunctional protein kinase chain/domain
MDEPRLRSLLDTFPSLSVLVVGDFFLDKYLYLERALSETSLETGLEAYQVVGVACSPGAAGSVTSKLAALDLRVATLGFTGTDGEGYELRRCLAELGVDAGPLLEAPDLLTPTYTKPMMREADGRIHELNRLDIKNRQLLPAQMEAAIIAQLRQRFPNAHGVVVADQVTECNQGVITDRVRAEIEVLARAHPGVTVIADSRARAGCFHDIILKPNVREAALATRARSAEPVAVDTDLETAWAAGRTLFARTNRPVFVTVSAQGILCFSDDGEVHIPAVPVEGEIDVVGAGDSVMAGLVAALAAGATPEEAAVVGNLIASITIQQLGTTGIARRDEVLARFRQRR